MAAPGFFGFFDFTGLQAGAVPFVPKPTPPVGFYSLLDFTGLQGGAVAHAPISGEVTQGFLSLFDFTGLPVGEFGTAIPVSNIGDGFYSLFDFTGLPVGEGIGIPLPVPSGHSPKVGGKLYLHAYLRWLAERREAQRRIVQDRKMVYRTVLSWKSYQFEREQRMLDNRKKHTEKQMYSVLLALI